jgi:Predicted signal transduction protein with a C-terminal ATPase domain
LLDGVFTGYAIIDRYQDVLYSSNPAWQADDFSLTTLFDYHKLKDSKSTFQGVYYYAQNPATGWFFISYAPYTLLLSNLFTVFGIITLLYLISPLLYGIFLIPTASRYLSPLTKLYDSMKYYKAGEQISLEIRTGDEIEELSNIYNQMIEKINNQIEDIKDKEHVNAVVNFKLLATQIDPHFIYNTMNIINIMARQGNSEAIIEINSSLIKILRERLNSKLTISDTIEHELETLYQYKLIMDYRYENKIKTTVSIDEALLQKKIPKNILQPLTENAFYHGFGNKLFEQEGCIDILIYSVGQELVIEVSDNGAGMSDERLAMLMNRSYHIYDDNKPHIGLDNIRQRLEYVYQGNYEFNISSNLGFGTTISITIPLEMPAA